MSTIRRISGLLLTVACTLPAACGSSFKGSGADGGSAGLDAGAGGDSSPGGSAGAGSPGGPAQAGGSAGGARAGDGNAGAAGDSIDSGGMAGGLQTVSNKLDVLLVIDNSVSMGDKQAVLEATLPAFVKRLTNPLCVDARRKPVANQPSAVTEACITGTREFTANDVHVGVISTSLGAHGGAVCAAPATPTPTSDALDDRAELLGKRRAGLSTWQNSGFLAWDPSGVSGDSNAANLAADLSAIVSATGEHGCGYEAPLEAMYRFLVDPEPPATVAKVGDVTVRQGIDSELLAERAAFLRPDSAVAILMLSDENDCSIRDEGLGWMVGSQATMPNSTAACLVSPNDRCCRPCTLNEPAPPSGCVPLAQEIGCQANGGTLDRAHDSLSLRCLRQKARFGVDLLYPTSRYTAGLSDLMISNNAGKAVKNPLFFDSDGVQTRLPNLVTLSVIVGVPWQDLATADSVAGGPLEYLDTAQLSTQGRWQILMGDPKKYQPASDPLMLESSAPRTGIQPITLAPVAPATSQNPQQNPINGHEQNIPDLDDLQYACIFELAKPKVCLADDAACDCSPTGSGDLTFVTAANSPVCQPPAGGPPGSTQYYAKAYPGLRELEVAHDLGQRGVPASICAKTLSDAADPDFGYGPAFDALLRRVGMGLE